MSRRRVRGEAYRRRRFARQWSSPGANAPIGFGPGHLFMQTPAVLLATASIDRIVEHEISLLSAAGALPSPAETKP